MLQVATSDIIVGPTRLLFPRAPGGVGEAADFPYSLLGLGDIAIPGELCCQRQNLDRVWVWFLAGVLKA
jgi:minor histocompatibility antigen H13